MGALPPAALCLLRDILHIHCAPWLSTTPSSPVA